MSKWLQLSTEIDTSFEWSQKKEQKRTLGNVVIHRREHPKRKMYHYVNFFMTWDSECQSLFETTI